MPQPEVWEAQFRTWQSRTIFTSSLSFLGIQFGNKPCGMCFETSPRLDLFSLFPPSLPRSEPSPRHASQLGSLPPGSPGHPQCCLISLPKKPTPSGSTVIPSVSPYFLLLQKHAPPLVQEFLYLPTDSSLRSFALAVLSAWTALPPDDHTAFSSFLGHLI